MRQAYCSTFFFVLCLVGAGQARAERQPSLDEALAGVLQDEGPAAQAGDGKLCRALTDMGRRSRKATVCMGQADWDALVRAARAPKRATNLHISAASLIQPYPR